ncbi:GntR family transcriptional regulator [Rhodococcus sp. RS1C4]|uniref:GntR family transcriptional regulator n=1 Tax=Nocardiaceae TaxID=85025 RepID=UPI0003746936|nr:MULTISPECIES: GntR family transcriptional regulator [Rhodococcus]OZC55741.1 GntR family transcriptional regulator [Rhodococcus sp. 06-621-2]OZC58862.1 GntR family transcriptional regulator [Rhodococcus sp. RS1C4]OZC92816.1 GntR family transcriptional regulator [Rhodococcus sp. 06-418-1B]OZD07616.1 GntR family transcriptional regulator [Rhodococcus sp. 06-156-4C]OZD17173.1 GntR family transcriptional regulator [Rhodococcus sp. 06-156-3C]
MPPRRRSVLLAQLSIAEPGGAQPAILDELRRVILSGDAPPNTPIPLGDVAELFGVSRIPVRESLKTLIGEGLVDHRPNLGYTVAQLTSAELREMYIVREVLESAALATAVALADEQDRERAIEADRLLEESISADDPREYHRRSREFHMALTRPSRMKRLLHMLESAWNITEPIQPMVQVAGSDRASLHADHRSMLDAFLDRDAATLLAISQSHSARLNTVISSITSDTGLLADSPGD